MLRVERIGVGYGLSGEIRRLHATISSGDPVTLVAKIEDVRRTRRAITVRRYVEGLMGASMPTCFGSCLDGDEGLLLLQDVSPAVQGDELEPCSRERAAEVVWTVAALHAYTIESGVASLSGVERWQAQLGREEDRDRLTATAALALLVQLYGVVGWAGEHTNSGFHERKSRLRDESIQRLFRAIDWIDLV